MVQVGSSGLDHGNTGREGNRATKFKLARLLFRAFVERVRTTTGRTKDANGRYHGAAFYLWVIFDKMRYRTEPNKMAENGDNPNETVFTKKATDVINAEIERLKGLCGVADDAARACGVAHLVAKASTAQVPCHRQMSIWFVLDFGHRSERGHTTLHPPKSDYCAMCLSIETDLAQHLASLLKHRQQEDQTEARLQVIEELEQLIVNCKTAQAEHRAVATAAVENYDLKTAASRADYVAGVSEWNRVRRLHLEGEGELSAADLAVAAKRLSSVVLVLESDYQMDKFAPHWVQTPQPGPAYFMSHEVYNNNNKKKKQKKKKKK
jgi:hypothetical protein